MRSGSVRFEQGVSQSSREDSNAVRERFLLEAGKGAHRTKRPDGAKWFPAIQTTAAAKIVPGTFLSSPQTPTPRVRGMDDRVPTLRKARAPRMSHDRARKL